ncbi:cupin domain-containing protein [Pedobacter insulae]|uniref:Quercetin 2,3-dioxygenase C-terminal cupin domain-containing protein n=1 Tax=Pedobacter insulae TaxID=414048 RepID=A0A1I2WL84_9SPHI|nr:hypothetical protein [Pedobacter insulae]SFH01994.1 hypothetical protein SAMN04489864_104131 [Pedobacter insulae]
MEEKHNNATAQRPAGARPLDAAIIPIDIPKYISELKQEEAYNKNGKNAITVFKSDKITITLIALKEGEDFHPGQSEGEAIMSIQLINGHLSFESLGTVTKLTEGQLLTLHQELSFTALAISDSICLLTLFKGH